MIVICEECGKKYRIDQAKIKGKAASFKCRACAHLIVVSKPDPHDAAPAQPPRESESRSTLASVTSTVGNKTTTAVSGAAVMPSAEQAAFQRPHG
jgi:predicted Zn finger-like uncharacterized protein